MMCGAGLGSTRRPRTFKARFLEDMKSRPFNLSRSSAANRMAVGLDVTLHTNGVQNGAATVWSARYTENVMLKSNSCLN